VTPLPLVAVAGNPNAGKSALFNALTGARQKVGNYPGVTVERHVGRATLPDGAPVEFVDLPGAYGLDKPRLEVVLREKGKNVAELKFGSDSQNPAGVYLKSANPPIMTVSKDLYDRLNVKWSDLLEPQPAPTTPVK